MAWAAVAAGTQETAAAAREVLELGGNAFDACLAAGFAAAVAEPGLTSLGGGGFLLARTESGEETLFDFFVDAPGLGEPSRPEPRFVPVTVSFAGADQVFHAGGASVAVPGVLAGYLHVHRRLGKVSLADVVAPAARFADEGVLLRRAQAEVIGLIAGILTLTAEGRATFLRDGRLLRVGDRLAMPTYGDFLRAIGSGGVGGFGDQRLAAAISGAMAEEAGFVTGADLDAYRVRERDPLVSTYQGARIATNPAPSFGGPIVLDALAELGSASPEGVAGPAGRRVTLEALRAATERQKAAGPGQSPRSSKGTTHISVADGAGNLAAMTTSNGSCSGVYVPGTGIQLNNVMGEADLHPLGFHAVAPGTRIGSMMSPTLVTTPDGSTVILGSGGSERIRSALLAVVLGVTAERLALGSAVAGPRAHWDGEVVQVEPGLPAAALAGLAAMGPVNVWPAADLYFGGVHAVRRDADGTVEAVGDTRRDGVGIVFET